MKRVGLLAILLAILISGCGRDSDQEQFEREAFGQPENFTRTSSSGEILSEDPDDWRIAPMFQGFIDVNQPPFPNPSTGTRFRMELLITGLESINGVEVYARDEFGRPFRIYTDQRRPLPPGITELMIEPSWLTTTGLYSNAIGLHRIFIYDANGNMITYGDLKVE